jgi:hypothetical protein
MQGEAARRRAVGQSAALGKSPEIGHMAGAAAVLIAASQHLGYGEKGDFSADGRGGGTGFGRVFQPRAQ